MAVSSPTKSDGGYGTFTMTAAGAWIYTLDNANSAVQALNAGDMLTDSFTVTTIDGTPQMVTITINGSNDAAVISGTAAGSVVEAGDIANATPGTPTASGTLTDTDLDNPLNSFTPVSSPTKSAGGYGTFTMTAAGAWIYTLDNANSAVQALNAGDMLTDSFTVTTIDGTPQMVTITINGSNDAAVISGTAAGSVVEAGEASPGTPTASGTLTDTDVDNAPNTFMVVSSPTESDGGYGIFTMTAAGAWTYTLDNNNSTVDALNIGDTLTDSFTVHTIDGTTEVVTISIHGASDADPNDFDNLAVGTVVISDPPFVYGTPGSDSIAGGGDTSQIIYGGAGKDTLNGTGVNDTIYGGSGNDTIKGNGGDDTIYGGSGSDTISGSNGNDIIIGGFGADQLTGSNGNDHFVYLSVADSRAGQFDTITDFVSESDKIDLTALGALAFGVMALSPTSTSVPGHTIAWRYDSTANETIVYVNPTDHTLSIGNSSLLEIHLQGSATIDLSDFILAPATVTVAAAIIPIDMAAAMQNDAIIATSTSVDVLSDTTVGGAPLVAANWTAQSTSASYVIDAASSDDLGFPNFDEVQTYSTEYAADHMAIASPSGRSIELHHVAFAAPIQTSFTFDQMPAINTADVMTIGHGAVTNGLTPQDSDWILPSESNWRANSDTSLRNEDYGLSVSKNAGGMNEANTHADTIDSSSNGVRSAGVSDAPENGAGNHSISSEAGEHGTAPIHEDHGLSVPKNAGGMNEANTQADTIDSRANGVRSAGVSNAPENGAGNHSISSEAGEHGTAPIHEDHGLSVPKNAGGMNEANTHVDTIDSRANGVRSAGVSNAPENGAGNHSISSEAGEHGTAPIHEDHGLSVKKNAGGMNEANTQADTIDSSSNGVRSAGVSDAPENGAGNHSISSEAGEHGTAPIHGAGVHDIEPSSIAHVVFGGLASMPGHEASFHFKDEISTPNGSGVINLAELGDTLGSISHHENSTGNHAPHEIAEIVQTIDLSLSEQHSADPFDMVAKHEGNAVVTHVPHDLIV